MTINDWEVIKCPKCKESQTWVVKREFRRIPITYQVPGGPKVASLDSVSCVGCGHTMTDIEINALVEKQLTLN